MSWDGLGPSTYCLEGSRSIQLSYQDISLYFIRLEIQFPIFTNKLKYKHMKFSLRLLYLYLFSFVGLLITIIGSIQILDLTLKTYVFRVSEYTYYPEATPVESGKPKVDPAEVARRNQEEQSNQRKRQISSSLAMILVGAPVYLYHWKTIKSENGS